MGEQVAARLFKEERQEKWKSGRLTQWGRSSAGRAPALQAGGQEFESLHLHWRVEEKESGMNSKESAVLCRDAQHVP